MPGRYDAGRFAYMMRFARLKEVTRDAFVLEALGTGETISLPRKSGGRSMLSSAAITEGSHDNAGQAADLRRNEFS